MRYWLFALNTDSLYEAMRASVDASLGLSGATCIQPAASAIRDSKGRIMLAIGPDTPGYELLLIQLQVLQLQGKVTEITRADYIAGLEPAAATSGGVSSWNDLADKPASFTPSAHASTHGSGGSDPITPASIGAQRTITSGTAIPTGGSDGDIYLQYPG